MAEQSALVMLAPDDSIDAIIQQVKKAGATHVDLLMPEGSSALQSRKACDKLRESANRDSIELTLYTADPKIVKAAQICQMTVVELDAAALVPAGPPSTPKPSAIAAPVVAPVAPPAPAIAARPRSLEEDFLASLESVPNVPPPSRLRGADTIALDKPTFNDQTPEDDWASALDSFSVATIGGEAALRDHEKAKGNDSWDFDSFNDLSDAISGEPGTTSAAPARPRVRAEDIELSSDDLNRQLPKSKRDKPEKKPRRSFFGGTAPGEAPQLEILPDTPRRRPRTGLLLALVLLALALLALWWFFVRKPTTTITVRPPAQRVGVQTYNDIRINYQADASTDPTSAAIQGRVIQMPVSVTVRGRVETATSQPDKSASGYIRIYNRNLQAYTLPANTKVTTTNPQGQTISFVTTQEVTVPAASGSFAGTTSGVADVPIMATAAGESYNLPATSEPGWGIEGFDVALVGINPEPIGGGTNILQKIPTEADIRPLLNQAVPLFKQAVPEQLRSQLQQNEQVAGINFSPPIEQLAQNPTLYDMQTRPIPDTDGEFELILTATFRGLAVTTDFANQLTRALPNALRVKDPAFNQETTDIVSNSLHLSDDPNANLLLASVTTAPKSTGEGISAEVQARITNELKGLTSQQALLKLTEFRERGLIGEVVEFPQLQTLPDDAARIRIAVQP